MVKRDKTGYCNIEEIQEREVPINTKGEPQRITSRGGNTSLLPVSESAVRGTRENGEEDRVKIIRGKREEKSITRGGLALPAPLP